MSDLEKLQLENEQYKTLTKQLQHQVAAYKEASEQLLNANISLRGSTSLLQEESNRLVEEVAKYKEELHQAHVRIGYLSAFEPEESVNARAKNKDVP